MLDDLEYISKIDKSGMIKSISTTPEQINESIDIVESAKLISLFKIDNIVISGMGSSGISGDIVQYYLRNKLDIPVFVSKGYDLPKWTNKNTLLISQSYSGDTEETLSTFKHGYQKRCKIIGISSGGKLQEFCDKREIPHILIPSGFQPRAATTYILFSSILALKKVGLLRKNIESEIEESLKIAKDVKMNNDVDVPELNNLAKQIALKIYQSIPIIYGWDIYSPIGKRWCQQFNENSKLISFYNQLPDASHNDIVGWSMYSDKSNKMSCIIFRDKEIESIYMSKRIEFMKKIFNETVHSINEVYVQGKKRLSKIVYSMLLGDYISCYVAILRNIDPTPIVAIDELKEELAKI